MGRALVDSDVKYSLYVIFYLHDILTAPNGAVPRPVGGADIDGSGFREARPHRPALPVRCTDAATFGRLDDFCSSVVRAPVRKTGGRGFDSRQKTQWIAQRVEH